MIFNEYSYEYLRVARNLLRGIACRIRDRLAKRNARTLTPFFVTLHSFLRRVSSVDLS